MLGGDRKSGTQEGRVVQVRPHGITCPGTVSWPLRWQLFIHVLPGVGGGQERARILLRLAPPSGPMPPPGPPHHAPYSYNPHLRTSRSGTHVIWDLAPGCCAPGPIPSLYSSSSGPIARC